MVGQSIMEFFGDQKRFFVFLIIWVALVLKDWNRIGWASAGWKFLERGILAVKALFWPAVVLAGLLGIMVLFVAPTQKYQELEDNNRSLNKDKIMLQGQLTAKDA
jgi:hypothetical protein